jgi:hypothetical protein
MYSTVPKSAVSSVVEQSRECSQNDEGESIMLSPSVTFVF